MMDKEHNNKISRKDIFKDRVSKIRRKTFKIISEHAGLIIENLNLILDQIPVIEVEITEYTEEVCYYHDNLRIGKIKRIYREDSDILLEMDNGDKILLDRLNLVYLRIVEHIIYSNLEIL